MGFGAVAHRASLCIVSLDCALEAFTFGNAACVYSFACREYVSLYFRADFVCAGILQPEFLHIFSCGNASLFKVTLHGLCYMFVFDFAKANLNRFVAVVFHCLFLDYNTGACFQNCYGHQCAVFREDLCHADFLSYNSLLHDCCTS